VGTLSRRRLPQLRFNSSVVRKKAGGRVEHLGRTPKKNHPGQIVRKMPLAYDNQRHNTMVPI
jgi:protein-arginine kinase activator protein McsA